MAQSLFKRSFRHEAEALRGPGDVEPAARLAVRMVLSQTKRPAKPVPTRDEGREVADRVRGRFRG
jgi:hypothetical protein